MTRTTMVAEKGKGTVSELSDDSFDGFIKSHKAAVVDCWAPWCGPCRMMGPVLEEVAKDFSGKIAFGKLNVDGNKTASQDYDVRSIPTFLIFKDGKLADTIIGAMQKEEFASKLNAIIRR